METFKVIISLIFAISMSINPFIILPQLLKILETKKSKDVAVSMYLIFFFIQLNMCLHGWLNIDSRSMVWGMGASAVVSLLIIIFWFKYRKN